METLLTIARDEQADYSSAQACSSLALMNSAPAELLHPLTYAALQPNWLYAPYAGTTAIAKKNAGHQASVGILCKKEQTFFQRKSRLPRLNRVERLGQKRS
jgi:hypothetical protein